MENSELQEASCVVCAPSFCAYQAGSLFAIEQNVFRLPLYRVVLRKGHRQRLFVRASKKEETPSLAEIRSADFASDGITI
jgi:hypothetical protein